MAQSNNISRPQIAVAYHRKDHVLDFQEESLIRIAEYANEDEFLYYKRCGKIHQISMVNFA